MSDSAAVDTARELFIAFSEGRTADIQRLVHPDISWTVFGGGPLAGTHEGRPAFLDLLDRARELSQHKETTEVKVAVGDDRHAMFLVHVKADTDFGHLDIEHTYLFEVAGGAIVSGRTVPCQQDQFTAFWTAAARAATTSETGTSSHP